MSILLVDDEAAFTDNLAERLKLRGFQVHIAHNADQALRLLAAESPAVDLAFVDVSMPGMSGVELLAQMQIDFPAVDVVMLSGSNDVGIAVQAMRMGAHNWLRKPVNLDDMLKECALGAERKQKSLHEARLAATAHLHSLGRVAEGVAHEVNNPVNIMMQAAGWVEDLLHDMALEAAAPPEAVLHEMRQALQSIRQQSVRVREITQRLLMFGKGLDAEIRPLCVTAIVEQVLESLRARAQQQKVRIVVDIPPELPQPIGSTRELYQVCVHCIENALDAMSLPQVPPAAHPADGTLTIRACQNDLHSYELHFIDSGHGIPPDVLPHIFEPFFSTRPVGKGTGLGLAVCQSLLHRRDAGIFVNPHPTLAARQGTDMVVLLPLNKTSVPS